MAVTRIFLTTTGAGNWTVPSDWNGADNTIEVLGGGASGKNTSLYSGGGGGAYSSISNLSLTPGTSIPYSVGIGGPGSPYSNLNPGGDTWFGNSVYASANVAAKGATAIGGQASLGIGTIKYSGGNAQSNNPNGYMGGGGAAGPHGNGNDASLYVGGSGDAGYGGAGGLQGGNGGNGTEWDSTHGSGGGAGTRSGPAAPTAGFYGAGGTIAFGGYSSSSGSQGIIVITYTPALPPAQAGFLYTMI